MTVSTQQLQKIRIQDQLNLIKELKIEAERKMGQVIDDFREQTGLYPSSLNLGSYSLDGKVIMGVIISL